MAEFTNIPRRSSAGWIIGAAIAVALGLVLVVWSAIPPASTDAGLPAGGTAPVVETTPAPAEPLPPAD